MEGQRDEIIHQNNLEKEDLVTRYEREKEQLQDELNALQRDRDEQLLLAENDKQQVTHYTHSSYLQGITCNYILQCFLSHHHHIV